MQSVYQKLRKIFPKDFLIKIPYLDDFGENAIRYMADSKLVFMGGTNALSAEMNYYKQIGLNDKNAKELKNKLVLMGVGWWQYQNNINEYTKNILREVLSCEYYHSCRDSYTVLKLNEIGIKNVINTGCPTIWEFSKEHCAQIPEVKAKDVLIGFTDYNQKRIRDSKILEIVKHNYEKLYCWIQSPKDLEYVSNLCPFVNFISPNIEALEQFLNYHIELDYVGTRLHAGIKCLQNFKRSIIIGIDNRAISMGKDFNLPILNENELDKLDEKINSKWKTEINIPELEINLWVQQFLQIL